MDVQAIQEIVIAIWWIAGGILGLLAGVYVLRLGRAWVVHFERRFAEIDRALVPFGQSPTGQYLHGQLASLIPYVDEPGDRVIRNLASLPFLKELYDRGVVTEEAFRREASKLLSEGLGLGVELLDGVPAGDGEAGVDGPKS